MTWTVSLRKKGQQQAKANAKAKSKAKANAKAKAKAKAETETQVKGPVVKGRRQAEAIKYYGAKVSRRLCYKESLLKMDIFL